MYTRGRKGGSLGDSNTSQTPYHKISNMEVDTEAQKLADELTMWFEESASRSACRSGIKRKDRIYPANTQACSSSLSLPSWATVFKSARDRGGPGLSVARGRDPSGIESFGYVCEDQAAGPLRGSLWGGQSLRTTSNR